MEFAILVTLITTKYQGNSLQEGKVYSDSFRFMYFMYMFGFHVCMCTMCMPGTCGGQNRTSDPRELEYQMVVSYHMDAEHQTLVLCKNNQCS